ncbi:MAG: hypothetical protein ACD_22C00282G0001 [uncultured bacterium]|nr:MAG: hypothetical protein ACD_22C00282G0001 [uncultured bacterium]
MLKIETIWHHLLFEALNNQKYKFTQKELANEFFYSLSTINHSLKIPSQIGAIRKESKFFVLENFTKLLYMWASLRNLDSDIIYQTYVDMPINEIESLVPPQAIYACYSAARKILVEPPADYSKVYFYLDDSYLEGAKNRFPKATNINKESNVYVLKANKTMIKYGPITTLPQTFVDIWNTKDWYGHPFIQELQKKMEEKYAVLS